MKKKNRVLITICIFLVAGIIFVVAYGEKTRDKVTNSVSGSVLTNAPQKPEDKSDAEVKPSDNGKATNEGMKSKERFEGLKLTKEDYGIPVLCYHGIEPNGNNDLLLEPKKFREQLKYLKDNGYTPITLSELYGYLKEDKAIPEKSVLITFDDGYKSFYANAFPILKEFNFLASVFMISDFVDNSLYLSKEQLKEINDYGIEIASHTAGHEDLSKLTLENQESSMKKSKEALEAILNKPVDFIAYPNGKINNNTKKAVEDSKYKMGFVLSGVLADKKDNIYTLDRMYIGSSLSLQDFVKKLNTKTR